MYFEELEDAEDDIVGIAESTCFSLLCVVQSSCPVDGDVCCSAVDAIGCADAPSAGEGAELEYGWERWAIFSDEDCA